MSTLIYARSASGPMWGMPQSVEDQIANCRRVARQNGWSVTGVFREVASGRLTDTDSTWRPGLVAMYSAIRAGGTDRVLVQSFDRIARDLHDIISIREQLARHGVKVVSLFESGTDELGGVA